jgi:lipopolysaccharide heptosyltransferase II
MNKIKALKLFDRIFGKLFISLVLTFRKQKPGNKPETLERILFIRPGGIGDAVLLIPALQAFKSFFPTATIDILCEKRNAEVFTLSYVVRQIYLYDRGFDLITCLQNKYDTVIDTEQWHRLSAVAGFMTGAPVRIGFDTNERSRLFTHKIPYSHDDYEVYSFFHLIEPLLQEKPFFDESLPFIEPPSLPERLLKLLQKKGDNNHLIAIFPGASVEERRWGAENFGRTAETLQKKGYQIIILGSFCDFHDAETIKKYARDSIDLTGKTSLREVAGIVKQCRLLITADSGLMHLAFAVGTPTVSLFGSGIEKKWAPRGGKHIVLNERLACSPCTQFGYTPRCQKQVECLHAITVEKVYTAALKILS